MKTGRDDSLMKAWALLQQTAPGEDHAVTESSLSADSCDIGELLVAELRARRERLSHWISLLSEEAGVRGGFAPTVCGSRYQCRAIALCPRAERRLGARRHSTSA
jgi:hypothetical protein